MAVTLDILTTYRHPRQVVRRLLAGPAHEGRALAYLMIGCVLVFVAQLPRLSRETALEPGLSITERASGELLFWVFFAPLLFYGIAAASHGIAKLFGGQGNWYGARMATFWALLALSPLWLLRGLVAGLIGPGLAHDLVGLVALTSYAVIWIACLREAESGSPIAEAGEVA